MHGSYKGMLKVKNGTPTKGGLKLKTGTPIINFGWRRPVACMHANNRQIFHLFQFLNNNFSFFQFLNLPRLKTYHFQLSYIIIFQILYDSFQPNFFLYDFMPFFSCFSSKKKIVKKWSKMGELRVNACIQSMIGVRNFSYDLPLCAAPRDDGHDGGGQSRHRGSQRLHAPFQVPPVQLKVRYGLE